MRLFFICLLLASAVNLEAYKVLLCFPFPVRSMNSLGDGYARHLINAGHEVTFITAFPKKQNIPNLREIDVSDNYEIIANENFNNISFILENILDLSSDVEFLQRLTLDIALKTLENKDVKALMGNPKETFHVFIADLLETELYAGFAALYNCPLIWAYSMGAHWVAMRLIDDPTNPAYSSDYFTTPIAPFSFTDRFRVLWENVKWRYAKIFITQPKEEAAYISIFGPELKKRGMIMPDYDDLIYNASLVLSNDHHASGNTPKTPQNWKFVGGFHIEAPVKPLPEVSDLATGRVKTIHQIMWFHHHHFSHKTSTAEHRDLKTIMDNAVHGVIYFSMGSVWNSELIPMQIIDGLLETFGELKATVIWKYEGNLPDVPKNVHLIKWAPQQSILAHPNCKLFITHGGLLSSTEALHFGVPIIGVPISYDQFLNIEKAVTRGYALQVALSYKLPEKLRSAINVVFDNPKYREQVKKLSKIYHDRPIAPGKELVHWIEHVIRTQGAPHLRSPANLVPLYQKAYLDILMLAIAVIALVIYLKNLVFGESNKRQSKKKFKKN
ncbi:2-hydroxyacylsphingosine 1-beta-galactosyltransferase-like [Ostrinia furnacalis]|uniref:2-hydroxyacylsphingosine 1-beta-galactosyltransferase-like n=1 Tax=Ostrinia furnacalis TaxID=93504 RepID=UPI00103EB9F0|nr:2-hydroxyacylsphingosine 1-beta-galactosyltransferase-like [Ostrinia furnacalis]